MGLGIGKALNSITGASDSAKQANRYNYALAQMSYQQQKEFAQNAHQWEMQDLQKAGLNPALTTGASSAGAIAGGGSTGGGSSTGSGMDILSTLSNVVNQTRKTNADIELQEAEAEAALKNADANQTSAKANQTNAETQEKLAKGGTGGKLFGTENGGLLSSIASLAAIPLGGGIIGGAAKGYSLYKKAKMAKGFSNFIKAATSAK